MKNSTLFILSFTLMGLVLSGCHSSSNLTNNSVLKKRRYMKGYQVNIRSNYKKQKKTGITVHSNPIESKAPKMIPIDASAKPLLIAQATTSSKITKADLQASATESVPAGVARFSQQPATYSAFTGRVKPGENGFKRLDRYSHSAAVRGTVSTPADSGSALIYVILAILLPPLAVGLLYGIGNEFLISLLLWLLFYIPGLIYALIKIGQKF